MRLIDADALKRLVDEEWFDCQEKTSFFDEIDRTPTIDPVKYVEWIEKKVTHENLWNGRTIMKPKTAFFLGAVSAKLDFLREDLELLKNWQVFPAPAEDIDDLIDSVDKIRGLVSKIYDAENAEDRDE